MGAESGKGLDYLRNRMKAEREGKTVKDHFGEMVKLMNELGNLFCH